MEATSVTRWWDCFLEHLRDASRATQLKEASLSENLTEWTRLTTETVVQTCGTLGWQAAARGHRLERLPVAASEYLALDVMAFPERDKDDVPWPSPVAVVELENSPRDERVAYSLWKVLCVRSPLRLVFAYRRDWEQTRTLIDHLVREVVGSMEILDRSALDGETAVVTGSRGESETFPHGYFKLWLLDKNLGKLGRI